MRGFDYKSISGIHLLIAKTLDSQRAVAQALNRVGRYDDRKSKRSLLNGTMLCDPNAARRMRIKCVQMNQFEKGLKTNKPHKQDKG